MAIRGMGGCLVGVGDENIPDGYKFNHGSKSLSDCRSQGCIPLVGYISSFEVSGSSGTTHTKDCNITYSGGTKRVCTIQAQGGTDNWVFASIQNGGIYVDILKVLGSYDTCKTVTAITNLSTITIWLEPSN